MHKIKIGIEEEEAGQTYPLHLGPHTCRWAVTCTLHKDSDLAADTEVLVFHLSLSAIATVPPKPDPFY